MDKKEVLEALGRMRDSSKQRKFTQSIELMINFRGIDFKKAANQIDVKTELPHASGKVSGKILVFAKDKHFISEVKDKVAKVIADEEIPKLGKKDVQGILTEYDVLLAEGPVMLTVGKYLGQQLAPKGKMPRAIQPNVKMLEETLSKSKSVVRITNKKGKFMPVVQVVVGKENMKDEELAENILASYNAVLPAVKQKQNIRSVFVKETMGPVIKIGKKQKEGGK